MQLTYRTGYAALDTRQDVQTVLDSGGVAVQQVKLPPAYNAILSIRGTDHVGTFSIDGGHSLVPGDNVDLYWADGVRTQGYVDSVEGELAVVDFDLVPTDFGCGTLPVQGTACIMGKVVDLQLQNIPPSGWDTLIFAAGARCLYMLHIEEAGEDDQFVHVYCPSPGVFIYGPTAPRISTPTAPVQAAGNVLGHLIPSTWGLLQAKLSHAGNNAQLPFYTHGLACLIDGGSAAQITVPSAAPAFSVATGTYNNNQTVALSTTTPEAVIYYTRGASPATPTTASSVYSSPLTVSGTETIKAIAVKTGQPHSSVASATYTLVVATPTVSPASGTYTAPVELTFSCATTGATIRYNPSDETVTGSSTLYNPSDKPFFDNSGSIDIRARGFKAGYTDSAQLSGFYTLNLVPAAPTFDVSTGSSFGEPVNLSVLIPVTSGTVYYTYTYGSGTPPGDPSMGDTAVTIIDDGNGAGYAPIFLGYPAFYDGEVIIRAMYTTDDVVYSEVGQWSGTLSIPQTGAPVFDETSNQPGSYERIVGSDVPVVIGAHYSPYTYYRLDGNEPSESDTQYNGSGIGDLIQNNYQDTYNVAVRNIVPGYPPSVTLYGTYNLQRKWGDPYLAGDNITIATDGVGIYLNGTVYYLKSNDGASLWINYSDSDGNNFNGPVGTVDPSGAHSIGGGAGTSFGWNNAEPTPASTSWNISFYFAADGGLPVTQSSYADTSGTMLSL